MRRNQHACPLGALLSLLLLALGCGNAAPEPPAQSPADAAAVVGALREPDPLVRAERLARAFQSLPPEALPEVRRAYEEGFFDLGDVELVLLAEWWARFDGPGAIGWSRETFAANAIQVQQAALRAWARRDPESALRFAEGHRNDDERALWVDAVLSGWEESGQPGAFAFVRSMPPGPDRQRAVATLARRKVLRDGVQAAFDWAEALPDDDAQFKLEVMRRVGSAAAEVDPELAAERAARLADGPYADGLLRRVGTRWAKRDGAAALRWLTTLPPGHARDDGVSETFRAWVRWDREGALRFMEGPARQDPALDPAKALYAQVLSRDEPLAAMEVTSELQDEDLRWATTGRVWRYWWTDDEQAAQAWFDEHADEIPEFYRERIRTIPQAVRKLREQRGRVVVP